MNAVTLESIVEELVAEQPGRSRVFDSLGINYCRGGKKALAEVCREKELDPETVRRMLEGVSSPPVADDRNWSEVTLTELADHIEKTHHAYLKRELPRLRGLVAKITACHGSRHSWLLELDSVFAGCAAQLQSHTVTEEHVLFPMIRNLDHGQLVAADYCGGSVANSIHLMEREHHNVEHELGRIRELLRRFILPPNGCNSFRAMLSGLEELETDTQCHFRKENSILFPRAIAAEIQLRRAVMNNAS